MRFCRRVYLRRGKVGGDDAVLPSAQEPGWGKQMFAPALVTISHGPLHLDSVSLLALLDNASEADLINEETVNKFKIPKAPLKVSRKLVGVHPQMTIRPPIP